MKGPYLVFAGMGFELIGLVLGSLWLGTVLDEHFQTKGMWVAGMSVLALAGWILHLIQMLKMVERNTKED
jgi:hypothetical protein